MPGYLDWASLAARLQNSVSILVSCSQRSLAVISWRGTNASVLALAIAGSLFSGQALALTAPDDITVESCSAFGERALEYAVSASDTELEVTTSITFGQLYETDSIVIEGSVEAEPGSPAFDEVVVHFPNNSESETLSLDTPPVYIDNGAFDTATDVQIQLEHLFSANAAIYTFVITCGSEPEADDSADSDDERVFASVARAFIHQRVNLLADETPDRPRMIRKRLDALWEPENASNASRYGVPPVPGVAITAVPGGGLVGGFGIRDMMHSGTYGADVIAQPAPPPLAPVVGDPSCWDVWAEGHYTRFEAAGDRSGDFIIGYAGVDCQVHASAIVGLLGQFDRMTDDIGVVDSHTEGNGWMVGPYATIRLTHDLFLDLRGAWGRSSNEIEIAGVSGTFDTERWLIHGKLTGDYNYDNFRVSPEVDVIYAEEEQASFVDPTGVLIDAQTVGLGRLRFGPEIAWRHPLENGGFVEPHFSVKGLWDFISEDEVTVAGVDYSYSGLRGVAEIGFLIQGDDNVNLRIVGKYDGIGAADYSAYGGQIWLNIPIY
jgi:hypothetical protein